jgi:hypothetical protein
MKRKVVSLFQLSSVLTPQSQSTPVFVVNSGRANQGTSVMGRGVQHQQHMESQRDVISERMDEEEKTGLKRKTDGEKEVIEQFRLDEEDSLSDREELKVSKHVSDGDR